MKQTILGMPPALYRRKLRQRSFLCIAVATGALALNILFTALRTDSNHNLMLFLNIAADISAGLFLLPFISLRILPQRRLLQLTQQVSETLRITIAEISPLPQRYMDMDCYRISGDTRTLFLPANTLVLTERNTYTLSLVSNIIVEASQ